MNLSRRMLLKGASALPLVAGTFGLSALAQTAPTAQAAQVPPILFVHGNGDQAGCGSPRCGGWNPMASRATG